MIAAKDCNKPKLNTKDEIKKVATESATVIP